jgi:hypothetical protein
MDGTRTRPRLLATLLVLAATLAVALVPPTASADGDDATAMPPAARWPAGGSTLRTALTMGAEHWAMSPCRGRVTIAWSGALGPGTNAQSTWASPGIDPYAKPARNSDCSIVLATTVPWDWPKLCTVVIHEVGHLTGHDHVDDPSDIMYYAYMEPAPECAATPEPSETGPPPAPVSTVARTTAEPKTPKGSRRPAVRKRRPAKARKTRRRSSASR